MDETTYETHQAVGMAEIAAALRSVLLNCTADLFDCSDATVMLCNGSTRLVLAHGARDPRRCADPLGFGPRSTWCFCRQEDSPSRPVWRLSAASRLVIASDNRKALHFAAECQPEPTPEHFVDMFRLAFALSPSPMLTVLNVHGSGASIPQHFHSQIIPLEYRRGGETMRSSIVALLDNIETAPTVSRLNDGAILLSEVVAPVWGLRFEFRGIDARMTGKLLHAAIQHEIRRASQLALAYNLYVPCDDPRVVIVLLREARKEYPFQTREILDLVSRTDARDAAERIADSDNARWRWGWLECIGGLPAPDDMFADVERFDSRFWEGFYHLVTLGKRHRAAVVRQVRRSLGGET